MGFCEEVVCINTCCKHSSDLTNIRVRFNGCCKNDHICFLKDLFVVDQVRSLYKKASVRLWNNFSYLAFDVVYAVLFYGSSVELIEVFTWSTDINIEYGYICIRYLSRISIACFAVYNSRSWSSMAFLCHQNICFPHTG